MNNKRYKHDCDTCTFLGTIDKYDVYNCKEDSIIARYGSDGAEYKSVPFDTAERFFNENKKDTFHHAYELYLKENNIDNEIRIYEQALDLLEKKQFIEFANKVKLLNILNFMDMITIDKGINTETELKILKAYILVKG